MPDRVILAIKYTPVTAPSALRKAVGGFLRYVQYRDKHADSPPPPAPDPKVSGLLKYVAYRDDSTRRGLLFGPDGPAGDCERRELATFVASAASRTKAQPYQRPDGRLVDRRRAVYRMVISPEDARGLDLRDLTRAAMQQLAGDAGATLRWVAAEHRNTAHPHVHVVLAAFTETGEAVRGLVVNRARLQRMKDALAADIARQRGIDVERPVAAGPRSRPVRRSRARAEYAPLREVVWRPRPRPRGLGRRGYPMGLSPVIALLRRAGARYRAEAERESRTRRSDRWFER